MKVAILALQGAFREHAEAIDALGAEPILVREARDLHVADALILPGGESTTIGHLLRSGELLEPLRERIAAGTPVLATCAGTILLAATVLDGRADQLSLGLLDITVRRNGYGRQSASFETALDIDEIPGGAFPGVFIRAPRIQAVGSDVEVLARHGGDPVLVRQGSVLAGVFHPELSGDLRIHQQFLVGAGHGRGPTAYDPPVDSRKGTA